SPIQQPYAITTAASSLYHSPGHEPVELTTMTDGELRRQRWNEIAIVMQSAMDCMNPVMRLGDQFADTLRAHRPGIRRQAVKERTAELLQLVGVRADRARRWRRG